MAKAGRPKAEVKKDKIISFRMRQEDYAEVKKYAEASQKSITEVIHEGVMKLIHNNS